MNNDLIGQGTIRIIQSRGVKRKGFEIAGYSRQKWNKEYLATRAEKNMRSFDTFRK
jgi:hypothetical protein